MRRKLIDVALPLKEISRQAAREKSIRHEHLSSLHLWLPRPIPPDGGHGANRRNARANGSWQSIDSQALARPRECIRSAIQGARRCRAPAARRV